MKHPRKKILLVEDDENLRDILMTALDKSGYQALSAMSGEEGLKAAAEHKPDVILLDIELPGIDGYEVKRKMSRDLKTVDIPVIFLTAKRAKGEIIRGLNLAAVDYVTKPFDIDELLARIKTHIDRRIYYEEKSQTDELTGLFNRGFFNKQVEIQFNLARRQGGVFSLLFVDIDSLKAINDSYGHAAGDRVIIRAARILSAALRKSDIITRIGGDEFVVIMPGAALAQARRTAAKIEKRIKNAVLTGRHDHLRFSVSIGASAYSTGCESVDQLIIEADRRMYLRKNVNKNIQLKSDA